MAQNLQLLKRRIKSAQSIAQISKAMEMISASKIKKAQNAVLNNKPYAEKITEYAQTLLTNIDIKKYTHPYLEMKEGKTLSILVSPDKGLCGSLNTNIFKKILDLPDLENMLLVTVGKKAEQFCARLKSERVSHFPMGTTLPSYRLVYEIIETINSYYDSKTISRVQLLFTKFNSVFFQEIVVVPLLPIVIPDQKTESKYIFEPDMNTLLKDLLPHYLEILLYNALLEAHTSEQAARMVAMQNAKNNALDIADYLTLSYNKSRQERITSEILILSSNI